MCSALVGIAHRTHAAGLVAATDGNVSARLPSGDLLISPAGCCLGDLAPNELVRVDAKGTPVDVGGRRPTSEIAMHVAIYETRPDVHAILHAHPPITIAFSVAGKSIEDCVIPEVVVGLGTIPTIPYTTPTQPETAEAVRRAIRRRDAVILEHHGTVTVARTIREAYWKLDKVEHTARILLAAHQLGGVRPLPPSEVHRLLRLREEHGLPPIIPNAPGFPS